MAGPVEKFGATEVLGGLQRLDERDVRRVPGSHENLRQSHPHVFRNNLRRGTFLAQAPASESFVMAPPAACHLASPPSRTAQVPGGNPW